MLSVASNRKLRGALPLELADSELKVMELESTSLNCHDSTMSDRELRDFAELLHSTPLSAWAKKTWTPAERLCIRTMGSVTPNWIVLEPMGHKECIRRVFPGTTALVPADYALGIGCKCKGSSFKKFLVSKGVLRLLCDDFQYVWIAEVVTFCITMGFIVGLMSRMMEMLKPSFMEWIKARVPPGALVIDAIVRSSDVRFRSLVLLVIACLAHLYCHLHHQMPSDRRTLRCPACMGFARSKCPAIVAAIMAKMVLCAHG